MNRHRLILLILVIVFVIAVIWSYSAMPRPKTVTNLTFKPGQQAKPPVIATDKPDSSPDDGSKLKLSLLEKDQSGFQGYHRNIFKPVFVDQMKSFNQPQIATIKPPPPPKMPQPVTAPPVEQVILQPEVSPLARFTFLGFMKKGSVKTIFLAKDKDILLVKKGDTIAGRYEATDITDQALTLTFADTGDEIVIPLIENQPLVITK